MISLNVYLTPKAGKASELEAAVRAGWMGAMVEQPGFLSAALLKPFGDEELAELQAVKPTGAFELVAFWRSEEARAAWVARPIHDDVFRPVIAASESVSYTVQTVEHSWNLG